MQKIFKTPRLLLADAYTIGSGSSFESQEAEEYSCYYLTFRRSGKNTEWGKQIGNVDDRIVFVGLQRIIDQLLHDPITHEEIDEAKLFFINRKFSFSRNRDFHFPENMWRRIVNEFDGYMPLRITGMLEGSVVYPNEPVLRVENTLSGFGSLAAWFESKLIQVWATTERLTAACHWLEYNKKMIRSIEQNEELSKILAGTMMHDFGDRSGSCLQESEDLGYVHLYCFGGTDTFSAAYQAWKNGADRSVGTSVDALAHRIVQGFVEEGQCYQKIYDQAQSGDLVSMVADCYDYYNAVRKYILPLAKRSSDNKEGITIVCRPDSADPLEQVLWTVYLAEENGLVEIKSNGYKYMTTLRLIEGDGMDFAKMKEINQALINEGFAPHGCLIYGVGGFLRNSICRDNFSTKYALCSVGSQRRPVIKFSNTPGKQTLPRVDVSRNVKDLETGTTLYLPFENKFDSHVDYYSAWNIPYSIMATHPFYKEGMLDNFMDIKQRIHKQFNSFPSTAGKISDEVKATINELSEEYCA